MRKIIIEPLDAKETFWTTPDEAMKHGALPCALPENFHAVLSGAQWDDISLTLQFGGPQSLHIYIDKSGNAASRFVTSSGEIHPQESDSSEEPILVASGDEEWKWDRAAVVQRRIGSRLRSVSSNRVSLQILFSTGPALLMTPLKEIESGRRVLVWFDLE